MNATPPGRAARTARLPLRAVAVLAALASVLPTLGFGLTDGPRAVRAARSPVRDAPAAPGPAAPGPFGPAPAVPGAPAPERPGPSAADPSAAPGAGSSDARPHTDDGRTARTVPLRPQRDAGERTVPAGHLLFTPAHTPRIPPRPARPAPAAGHAPPAAAHMPADLGRAPPGPSST
ncbi:hypothetical protein [Streptomyces sp. NEAU-W12]|uniref:hypothetical protein n=1 Tax=Streptomyces sp. NEAU-W12 TaxID=2994668 RepID=UPI00224B2161|nr:hypothetical protein [Streptomyces sp. NEAU-W12]MCX2923271.1 hypothetical protein [Streptomyces sp. NEAU-W12]